MYSGYLFCSGVEQSKNCRKYWCGGRHDNSNISCWGFGRRSLSFPYPPLQKKVVRGKSERAGRSKCILLCQSLTFDPVNISELGNRLVTLNYRDPCSHVWRHLSWAGERHWPPPTAPIGWLGVHCELVCTGSHLSIIPLVAVRQPATCRKVRRGPYYLGKKKESSPDTSWLGWYF